MSLTEPNYTKGRVRRAGDFFSIEDEDIFDVHVYLMHHAVLSNWRASHAYPLHSMLGYFRSKAKEVDHNAVIVQRLKRTPSIIAKLVRENDMRLDRMEDIGGCRIVVNNVNDVYEVRELIVRGRTRNTLRRERDYIKNPKESGYRGVHLIYRYNGQKLVFNGHHVELQIRSLAQHSWATAVEVVGTFTREALKASEGHEGWLRFFKLASQAFADIENKKLYANSRTEDRKELMNLIAELNVLPKLNAFTVTTNHIDANKKLNADYYLLTLDVEQTTIKVTPYKASEFQAATDEYSSIEKECKLHKNKDVVLVAAESISALKKAYPNYFADTKGFSRNLVKLMQAHVRFLERERAKLIEQQEGLLLKNSQSNLF